MHLQCWSLAALIGWAATVPEVQVNQSCSLSTEQHEHAALKARLLARPSSGTHPFLFLSLRRVLSLLE